MNKRGSHLGYAISAESSIDRVAARWLQAAGIWDGKSMQAAIISAGKIVQEQVPGARLEYTAKGLPTFNAPSPTPTAWLRYQLPGARQQAGIYPTLDAPFQMFWDVGQSTYQVTSFKEELKFRTIEALFLFLASATKVSAFVRKGIKTLDSGEADFLTGKMTPDGVINRILSVKTSFDTIDEWHTTTLVITLMLRTAKPVPEKVIKTWLMSHWHEVLALAPSKTPAIAGPPKRYPQDRSMSTTDWMQDRPQEGLGWIEPHRIRLGQADEFRVSQSGNRVVIDVSASLR